MTWLVRLTMPPSANHIWKISGRRMVKTDQYHTWIDRNGYGIPWTRISNDPKNELAWWCDIQVCEYGRSGDIDNRAKATIDLIAVMTGLRDLYCDKVTIERRTTYIKGNDHLVVRYGLIERQEVTWAPLPTSSELSMAAERLQPS